MSGSLSCFVIAPLESWSYQRPPLFSPCAKLTLPYRYIKTIDKLNIAVVYHDTKI